MSTCELKKALASKDTGDFDRYYENHETHQIIADIKALIGAKQAQLDLLMLEFCPDEMTPEQLLEWEQSQRLAGRTLDDLAKEDR